MKAAQSEIGGALRSLRSGTARVLTAAWRNVTPRRLLFTFALCMAWSAVMITAATSYFSRPAPPGPALNAILTMQFNGFAVMFSVLIADQLSPPELRRWWPY